MAYLSQLFKTLAAATVLAPSLAAAEPLFSGEYPYHDFLENRYGQTMDRKGDCVTAPVDDHDGLLVYNLNDFSSVAVDDHDTIRLQFSIPIGTGSRSVCDSKTSLHGDIPSALSIIRKGFKAFFD